VLEALDDFLFTLRREGFAVSTTQAIDVARAARAVGFEKSTLREAIACVVVDDARRRGRFDELFDVFFSPRRPPDRDLGERLAALGFSRLEIGACIELLGQLFPFDESSQLTALLTGGPDLDHRMADADVQKLLSRAENPASRGFFVHRVLDHLGGGRARSALARLESALTDAIGRERARLLVGALAADLEGVERWVKEAVETRARSAQEERDSAEEGSTALPLASLSDVEREEVRRAVRRFAERLRGAARVRERHRRSGRLDPAVTMRRSLRTGGVPFRPARVDRRRDRPRLALLCDISDSVRPVSGFMLELVYALQDLFERARSFVFVSDVEEVTKLFDTEGVSTAVMKAAGSMVSARGNSSYGRAFTLFDGRFRDAVDSRTTVVVLGDGRTNYQAHGANVLDRIRQRARRVVWLCPEPRSAWGSGDSAMPEYALHVSQVLEVITAKDLESAARHLIG
jgi:uncharacterized protein with von Willebrand factor type A (vWA) domain